MAEASVLKDLNLSQEEVSRFEKAFKDPKFKEMLSQYAQEISDPKNREESERYLRQLEAEGQVGEVYGKGAELIIPSAGFCVKTKNKTTGNKVFINICHSSKVSEATSTTRADGSGADWSIPYSLSVLRKDKDKGGAECEVHDFVVHPSAHNRTVSNQRFKLFVVDTALEAVEKQRGGTLDRNFILPRLRFKGPASGPAVQALRPAAADESTLPPGSRLQPKQPPKVPLGPSASQNGSATPTASPFSFSKPQNTKGSGVKPGEVAELADKRPLIVEIEATDEEESKMDVTPKHEVIHKGVMDLKDYWHDNHRAPVESSRPEALLVRVDLPLVASVGEVDLDVSEKELVLRVTNKYHLDLTLPYPVDESRGKARFDKLLHRLEVTLPVLRPPPPPPQPFQEPACEEAVEAEPEAQAEAEPEAQTEAEPEAQDGAKLEAELVATAKAEPEREPEAVPKAEREAAPEAGPKAQLAATLPEALRALTSASEESAGPAQPMKDAFKQEQKEAPLEGQLCKIHSDFRDDAAQTESSSSAHLGKKSEAESAGVVGPGRVLDAEASKALRQDADAVNAVAQPVRTVPRPRFKSRLAYEID